MLDRAAAEWRRFLSTPSVRRATFQNWSDRAIRDISIHALREEGDHVCFEFALGDFISIHALREEGDIADRPPLLCFVVFLSTPSVRRATP